MYVGGGSTWLFTLMLELVKAMPDGSHRHTILLATVHSPSYSRTYAAQATRDDIYDRIYMTDMLHKGSENTEWQSTAANNHSGYLSWTPDAHTLSYLYPARDC